MPRSYDVIVVGGGHAGCEAAAVAARMGASVALVTMDVSNLGVMSCNPAIGGIGKGHLVREIDAWGGLMARSADAAAIHYRMLNRSKGPAVRGPRVQADRSLYQRSIRDLLKAQDRLTIIAGEVTQLLIEGTAITGVSLAGQQTLNARSVILTTGTFLGAVMHRGLMSEPGGRVRERAATALADQLRDLGSRTARLKTGTPPRLDGRSVDWSRVEWQPSDGERWTFSVMTAARSNPDVACGVTRTNPQTHDHVRAALAQSPLRSGAISGKGPRYCPSIEDKVDRFGDRDGHQIFLEPEDLGGTLIYPNGLSTSLPTDAQFAVVRSIQGLEEARIEEPGYAVEYDYLDPRQLDRRLKLRGLEGLFLAGQINGTTGYEEAAAQGLVAGANATAAALNQPDVFFDRSESYIGVLTDDLTLQGVSEPYRMLTARAEHRLSLRADNADARLTDQALSVGAISSEQADLFERGKNERERANILLEGAVPRELDDAPRVRSLCEWLKASRMSAEELQLKTTVFASFSSDLLDSVISDVRYEPYVARQQADLARRKRDVGISLSGIDYRSIRGLSAEMVERLEMSAPDTLDAAARIQGITPAALSAVMIAARTFNA